MANTVRIKGSQTAISRRNVHLSNMNGPSGSVWFRGGICPRTTSSISQSIIIIDAQSCASSPEDLSQQVMGLAPKPLLLPPSRIPAAIGYGHRRQITVASIPLLKGGSSRELCPVRRHYSYCGDDGRYRNIAADRTGASSDASRGQPRVLPLLPDDPHFHLESEFQRPGAA